VYDKSWLIALFFSTGRKGELQTTLFITGQEVYKTTSPSRQPASKRASTNQLAYNSKRKKK
jgi:hypothetical protein